MEAVERPITEADGSVTGHVVVARDISARRELEEKLHQAQKLEAMGRMANGVAHDFNNLLTVIRSTTDFARKATPRLSLSEAELADITAAIERASALTAQLLAFSRGQHASPTPLRIAAILRQDLGLLVRLAGPTTAVELSIEPAAETAMVLADRVQLEQVLFNLVVNARDAMPGGGAAAVRCGLVTLKQDRPHRYGNIPAGEYLTLVVEDSGAGMSEEVLSHLFEPFFTTKPQGQGTGLGLATVFGTVEQARGSVMVESEPGLGSRFTVYWPRAADGVSDPIPDPAVAGLRRVSGTASAGKATRTLLLVDDESAVSRAVARLLEYQGYRVLVAGSGVAALEVLQREAGTIDVMITDVRMPGMTGVELVAQLILDGLDLPVLFVSGQLEAGFPTDWPSEMPRGFLAKPFTSEDLTRALSELLGPG